VKVLGVIPARFASSRLPGKPLADIAGRPMVQRVYEAARRADVLDELVVATDDARVADVVASFGGEVRLTSPEHLTGTDRCAEVASTSDADVVVNIQGDQPFVTPAMLTRLVEPFAVGAQRDMLTLGCPLDEAQRDDPSVVKVLCDQAGRALYFSRAAIPHYRSPGPAPAYHHLGLYSFTRAFLLRYPTLTPTPLEQCEQLEQLRALEHGSSIGVELVDTPVLEVNTAYELSRANTLAREKGWT
jgi:3-deoxy-manno-octulosonate cytidylyltransferase (CMP-KDO synthetase)